MTRETAQRLARRGTWLTAVSLLLVAAVYVRALAFTPPDRFQGPAQKIFYVHVPAGWSMMLGFSVTGILSVLYLWLKDKRLDLAAAASAEVGLAFGVVVLTSGPIWAKPIWGTWWTWDARLTSTLFTVLLFVGYQVLRDALTDPEMRALAEGELLTAVRVPRRAGVPWGYQKFVRRANDWAIVGVAAIGGRIALANMGPVPLRARAAEEALAGGASAAEAAALAAEGTSPGEDIHADREFREHLARVLTRRALEHIS